MSASFRREAGEDLQACLPTWPSRHGGQTHAHAQDSGHGEKIHAAREGRGRPLSGRAGLYRCRSTACWVSSRVVKASRGRRFSPPSSQRCSHMRLYLQHPGRAKTVARQQTRLTGPPPMSRVLESGSIGGSEGDPERDCRDADPPQHDGGDLEPITAKNSYRIEYGDTVRLACQSGRESGVHEQRSSVVSTARWPTEVLGWPAVD